MPLRTWRTSSVTSPRGEVEVDRSVIYHKTEYKERHNHYAFYSVNTPVDGFDTDHETFVGLYNEFADPER